MLQAEINGKVATSSNNNLVVTGIVNGKRANIFVGNGFIAGEVIDGLANVEPNKNATSLKGTPQYNFVSMVSVSAIVAKTAQVNFTSASLKAKAYESLTPEMLLNIPA